MAWALGGGPGGCLDLNLSWIAPQLAVGGCFPAERAEDLARALGISHVVDLRVEERDDEEVLRRAGIELLHLPTLDGCAVSLAMLDEGVTWVTDKLDRGFSALLHCQHGIGRSALLALCVLVARGAPPLDALSRAKDARRCISPSPEQLHAYRAWLAAWRSRTGQSFGIPRFEELAEVAYRTP